MASGEGGGGGMASGEGEGQWHQGKTALTHLLCYGYDSTYVHTVLVHLMGCPMKCMIQCSMKGGAFMWNRKSYGPAKVGVGVGEVEEPTGHILG